MTAEQLTAIGGIITALGIPFIAVVQYLHGRKINQVEKQGNSVALESKRVTSVALRLLAQQTKLSEHISKADDAEKVYEEAKKSMK